jgi:peptidoglycan/xylan/chitin deacetylase (PgdA/CDA1 family)
MQTRNLFAPMLGLLLGVAHAGEPDRRISITIDDLPWASFGADDAQPDIAPQHRALLDAIGLAGAPVVGFVNEGKLGQDATRRQARLSMLRDWLAIGAELGNHTFGHVDLHVVGVAAFSEDILRGEQVLRPLLSEHGAQPRWFRHPFLRAGTRVPDKQAVAEFLARHGYRIAPVTVDNSDWIWAGAYQRVLDGVAGDADQRDTTLARLREAYVPYLRAKLDYYEQQSIALLGYNVPHVLLLHANALNAASYRELIAAIRERGYRTVTLDEALRDPAYARVDGYSGAFGPGWIHRWAMAEKKPRDFYAGEPGTPAWVMQLANVDSE